MMDIPLHACVVLHDISKDFTYGQFQDLLLQSEKVDIKIAFSASFIFISA